MTLKEILRRQNEMSRNAAPVVQGGVGNSAAPVLGLSKEINKLTDTLKHTNASNDDKFKERAKKEEELTDSLKKLIKVIEIQTKGLGKVVGSNKDTSSVVETQETGTPGKLATGGLGETVGNKINAKEGALKEHAQASSGLRQLLLGGKSSEEIKKSSIFGFSSFVDKALSKREEKYAHKVEKKQYIEDAIKHDPTSYAREANFKGGMKTAEGRAVAEASAGKRFEAIKEKEKEVTQVHDKIESAKEAGFAPLKKDIESREKATKNLVAVDTRLQAQFAEETPETVEAAPKAKRGAKQIQQTENNTNVVQFPNDPAAHAIPANVIEHNGAEALQPAMPATQTTPRQTAALFLPPQVATPQVDVQADIPQTTIPEILQQEAKEQNETWREEEKTAAAESLANDKEIGKTLSMSLGIQKQQLEALTKIAESGGAGAGAGAGGGLIDTALDVATSLPGRGAAATAGRAATGFGGKAMNFLKGPGGKILGATAAVGMGAYEAYSGWQDANKDQAASNEAIDGQLRTGEITVEEANKRKAQIEDQTDVKKGEAVGGGAGGAGGALAGAAAGAAIGSAVPIIGTAIGGLVGGVAGYYGGSAIGSKVGGALTSGYKSVKGMFGFGGDDKAGGGNVLPPGQNATEDGEYATMNPIQKAELAMKSLEAKEPGFEKTPEGIKVTDKRFLRKGQSVSTMNYESTTSTTGGGSDVKPLNAAAPSLGAPPSNVSSAGPTGSGEILQNASRSNADLKADKESKANNIIVNAPTTNNSAGNQSKAPDIRAPLRNQESTVNTYIGSRYL